MTIRDLCIAAVFFVSSAVVAAPAHQEPSNILFPDSIAGFQRISFKDYRAEAPGLGVSYGYKAESGVTATIYVFSLGLREVPTSVNDPALVKLHSQTVGEIMQAAANRGLALKHALNTLQSVTTDQGTKQVWFDAFVARDVRGQIDSFLWLWTAQKHFIKIRLTANPEDKLDPNDITNFADQVVRITNK